MLKYYQKLPDTPGVYLMKNVSGRILYVGKAGNLKRRVSSYFLRPHDYRIQKLVSQIRKIDYKKTDTAIEALILEAELIKKYQPPFNVREKDDTSFLYVEITKEEFPRVLLVRGKEFLSGKRLAPSLKQHSKFASKRRSAVFSAGFGPFTSASNIREALRILRKIFPYSTHSLLRTNGATAGKLQQPRPCFDYQIGLCPGTCIGAISATEYRKNIKNLELFFRGKKKAIIKSLTKEMQEASKNLEFEKAEELKRRVFALQHIRDIALITEDKIETSDKRYATRIEGYDISNISGTSAVGSMVVFSGENPDKNEYRKFKIRTIHQSDDVGMLKEMLRRRFSRRDPPAGGGGWPLPYLILIDGGKGQVNGAKEVLNETGLKIPVVGIAKGPERKKNEFVAAQSVWASLAPLERGKLQKTLIKVRDEAHRFAIIYHKKVRGREFLE